MNNPFNEAIQRAEQKGWPEGARRMRLEKRMTSALIKACLKRGFSVTIDNGEDKPIEKSTSYRAIINEMWQTDEEHVLIYDATGKRMGWFFLVYGNSGWDLVSDYSVTNACEAIWNEVISPLADRMEEGK
jgi:hypothetical protein